MSEDGITEVIRLGIDTKPETVGFLALLKDFCQEHGYRDPVGVLIVPLMPDGFGIMAASDEPSVITHELAVEYLIDIGQQLQEFRNK